MAVVQEWFSTLRLRLRAIVLRRRLDRDLEDELAFHLAMKERSLVEQLASSDGEPHYAAIRSFGNLTRIKEQTRMLWTFQWLETTMQDMRFGVRLLSRAPLFSSVAALTLALGIGANTAVFSVVNTVLLRSLPYPKADRLVNVWRTHGHGWTGVVSLPDLHDWQQQNTAFEGISAYAVRRFSLEGNSEPQAVEAARVTANFFDVMAVPPARGRSFAPEEESDAGARVAVLGHDLWTTEFGSDPGVVGRSIRLNGDVYTVIGIAPQGFHYPRPLTNLWIPLVPSKDELRRDAHDFLAVGRLKEGVSLTEATTQLKTISARMGKDYPEDKDLGALLIPLKKAQTGGLENGLLVAFTVVGFIFIIACANVTTFLLSRAATRQREIAVRMALGAGRARLMMQFVAEGLLLAGVAGVVALLVARWSVAAIISAGQAYFSLAGPVSVDSRVALFTFGLAAFAALALSTVVGWSATRAAVAYTLKDNGATLAGGRARLQSQRLLVAIQVACAFLLLIGTGTLLEGFRALSRVKTGFDSTHVLAMRLPILTKKYSQTHPLSLLLNPALKRIQALPGVESAGVITYLPMQSWGTNTNFRFTDSPAVPDKDASWAEVRAVSSGYFSALRIRVLRGRAVLDSDSESAAPVAVVNQAFVKQYSPGKEVIGRQFSMTDDRRWVTIVGVVDDALQAGRTGANPEPEVDMPYTQTTWPFLTATMSLAVRVKGDPLSIANSVRHAIYSVDTAQAVYGITTMEKIVSDLEGDRHFALWLLGSFSLIALVLSAAGLFAQLSYAVAERTQEIGVRVALGANRARLVTMVVRQGSAVVAVGIFIGLLASLAMLKIIRSLLFGVNPAQPTVLLGAALLLTAIGLLASYVPARRATRIDPIAALRCS